MRAELFQLIYDVFLVLGTAVGVVVIGYMCVNAYRYRDGAGADVDDYDRPSLGETPTGGGGGKKLAVSFVLSTLIVVSLIGWTYGSLLTVDQGPPEGSDPLEVTVVGSQFTWEFVYPNGHTTTGELRVPAGRPVRLVVTSDDVFHNFGSPALRVKADALPGQTTDTWFEANQVGTYRAECYELCGVGHSSMTATVHVMQPSEYREWYANTTNESSTATTNESNTATTAGPSTTTANETALETPIHD